MNNARHLVFLINPISGTRSKEKLEDAILLRCRKENVAFQILYTNAEGDYFYLKDKVKEEKITDIIICGGDGSLRDIIRPFVFSDIHFGIVPVGSGNGLARTGGIPMSVTKALDILFTEEALPTDALLLNGLLSCHLSGLGFDAQVAHDFAKQKTRGLRTYIRQVWQNFKTIRPYSFEVTIDGKTFSEEALCVCVSNSNQFGNNFTIAPRASISDGLMDVVFFKKTNRLRAALLLTRQVLYGSIRPVSEKHIQSQKVLYFQTTEMHIRNSENAPLHIDGDPKNTAQTFHIEILPSAYKLYRPAK